MVMDDHVSIIGGGLAGSEAALALASLGHSVCIHEMRPQVQTGVHHSDGLAELVCSNSLKSTKEESAAGMLKAELSTLGSSLYRMALGCRVPAGGALAVDRLQFSQAVTEAVERHPLIQVVRGEVTDLDTLASHSIALVLATGPLTSDGLSPAIEQLCGTQALAFYDAAAPIVMAESLDGEKVFRQSRYEDDGIGDYLNAPFSQGEYEAFIDALLEARRVVAKEFETTELFQACQPIEEIARKGRDAPRFGPMKPVGLIDPRTGRRPWAALQLRAEDAAHQSYNLVGFQTNLAFPEQERVFRMIPGLEQAEFVRFGVMHRNTFIDAPCCLDISGRLITEQALELSCPVFVAGQLAGTEGYCEAIRSGLHCAIALHCLLEGVALPSLSPHTAFGALMTHATDPATKGYQPMHVNFGIMPPLDAPVRNKRKRYEAYANRGRLALEGYREDLCRAGLEGLIDG